MHALQRQLPLRQHFIRRRRRTHPCNCSICSRKGALLWAVPRDKLRLRGPGQGIGTYTFNNHVIAHRFCKTCGMHPYAEDVASKDDRSAYVNVRCLEGVEPSSFPVFEFDGRSM
jgi:hypothetical protein